MNKLALCALSIVLPLQLNAELSALDDSQLGIVYGQAIFEVKDQYVPQSDGSELEMIRLTTGARIEINANVAEVNLGRYWRPEGTDCTGGAGGNKVCYNSSATAGSGGSATYAQNNNLDWACTAKPCGSVGLDSSNYLSSALTHNVGEESFFNTGVFPGGYQPDNGVDIKLRDITMGQINCSNGVCDMTPFVQENPYFEFAFEEVGGVRQLVGFRTGAEDATGYQGNIIDVVSGFIKPDITVDAKLLGISVGTITLETMLGGVRTIGWIDAKNTVVKSTGGLTGLLINGPESLMSQSPTAQLFPVQSNYLNHTEAFFLSAGIKPITWSQVGDYTPFETSPGFWLNMGGDGGLQAKTQEGDHPVNYFPGHPKAAQYAGQQNYNSPQQAWSTTYQ